jgi:uroporphyrinogen-III synthase
VLQRLIVTRPLDEATDWVARLCAQGWPAQALPLIAISAPRSPAALTALHQHRAHWFEHDAILFVSGAAVKHFWAEAPPPPAGATVRTRCWAPGPGTARALRAPLAACGLGPDRIDAPPPEAGQFDSEALWPVVAPQLRPGVRVLIVRGASVAAIDADTGTAGAPAAGGNGREWLIRQCEQAGAQVQTVAAYERHAPVWGAAQRQLAQQAQAANSLWLFSSSEALDHLQTAEPAADWSAAAALVTHPRIAQRAQQAGFGVVQQTRPALADVLIALESRWSRP